MKLQLMQVIGIFVIPFIASMSLQARLVEQNTSSEFTLWNVEKHTYKKQVQANACTVLNLHYPNTQLTSLLEWIDAIVSSNVDMVCIQGLATIENARSVGEALENAYVHFLYLDPAMSERRQASNLGKLLIASKYSFTADDSSQITTNTVDFILNTYFRQEDVNALVLRFLTEGSASDYVISTHPVHILGQVEGLIAYIEKNTPYFPQCSDTLLAYQASFYPQTLQTNYCGTAPDVILVDTYGGGRVKVTFTPDGPEVSASAYGGYEDSRGNFVEIEVSRETDGSASASVEGGHEGGHDNRDTNK